MPPILRYIPNLERKEGESPFSECTSSSIKTKATKDDGAGITSLKGGVIVPTLKMWQAKVSRPPISGFVVSSKEGNDLLGVQTKEGFNPNAYRLMERAGYDFQNPATLGKVVCSCKKVSFSRYFCTCFILVIIVFVRFLFDFILFCRF